MTSQVLQCGVNQVMFRGSKKFHAFENISGFSILNLKQFKSKTDSARIMQKKLAYGVPNVRVSAASDFTVSGPLTGDQVKRKRRSIAGIDQDELLEPRQLADPDSCFCEFKGLDIHYKVCEPEPDTTTVLEEQSSSNLGEQKQKIGLPMILLHGFGASAFSWHKVMKPFAQITGSKVLAFDRPAFGLTSRVRYSGRPEAKDDPVPLNPYSLAFSSMATLYFIDFLTSQKAVLVGHSAGSLSAVEAYLEAPDRVAALILVAPAILAPLSAAKFANQNPIAKEKGEQNKSAVLNESSNLFAKFGAFLSNMYQFIVSAIIRVFRGVSDMANSMYNKALAAVLRSAVVVTLVRMIIDKFGIAAIRNAWYDATQVTDHILHGYTKPLRTKDWDRALIEYTAAMLTDPHAKLKPPLQKRLSEIACPVLIVTGDTDRLVPSWNSERLTQAIPGSQLEVIKNCGHLPHEEKPEEFVSVVSKFLHRVFSSSDKL